MKLYEVSQRYKGPNKSKPLVGAKWMIFEKGTFVSAERYSSGLANEKPMVIFDNKYIIPLSNLRELSDEEATKVLGEWQQSQQSTPINTDYLQPDVRSNPYFKAQEASLNASTDTTFEEVKAPKPTDIFEMIKEKSSNFALGAGLGAIGGFVLARLMKSGWPLTIGMTIAGGVTGGYLYHKIQTKKKTQKA